MERRFAQMIFHLRIGSRMDTFRTCFQLQYPQEAWYEKFRESLNDPFPSVPVRMYTRQRFDQQAWDL